MTHALSFRPLLGACALAASSLLPVTLTDPVVAQGFGNPDVVSVDVLPGWREADGTHYAGIRIKLAPGWKTYWRTPGDGGIPPHFDLTGSGNLVDFAPQMPRPTVFDEDGLRSLGYKTEVVFPLRLSTEEAAAPINLNGTLFIGVCEEICMPAEVQLQAELTAPGQSSALIASALAAQPRALDARMTCDFEPTENGLRVRASVTAPEETGEVAVLELSDPMLWVSHATTTRAAGRVTAEAEIVSGHDGPIQIARDDLRLTLISKDAAYDVQGCRS